MLTTTQAKLKSELLWARVLPLTPSERDQRITMVNAIVCNQAITAARAKSTK